MNPEYQIALMGGGPRAKALAQALRDRLDGLEVPAEACRIDGEITLGIENTVGVYWPPDEQADGAQAEAAAGQLAAIGRFVIPVVSPTDRFTEVVPAALHVFNGFVDDGSDDAKMRLANRLLEALGLIRDHRRLFVSYKRDEATGVANQFAAAARERGFQVFLDTQSIKQGVLFQPNLWDAMADTDIVVFMDTSTALDSPWVRQEFERAALHGITILHLVWPGRISKANPIARANELSELHPLTADDFWPSAPPTRRSGKLRRTTLIQVLAHLEHVRAQAYAVRRARLVSSLCKRLAQTGTKYVIEPSGAIRVAASRPRLVVPIVGHPESRHFQQADAAAASAACLLFRSEGLHRERLSHLEWLRPRMPCELVAMEALGAWQP